MGGLETTLFDANLQEFTNTVVTSVQEDRMADANALREKVADDVQALMQKEYPGKNVGISTCIRWKGVKPTFEVNAIIEHDGVKYTSTAHAELRLTSGNKQDSAFAEVVKTVADKTFKDLIDAVTPSTHEMILRGEELIKKALAVHYEGLEEDFEVSVTAGIGKDLSFRINVEDVRMGQVHEYTITYENYEEQTEPLQPSVPEVIEPASITPAQRGRAEKTLALTAAVNRAFTNAFLEHEQDRSAEEFAKNIRIAVLKQLGEEFPADDYSVRAECTEDMVATVWVEAPGVTKIRLRGHRAKTEVTPV
jgi:hypothetical protein